MLLPQIRNGKDFGISLSIEKTKKKKNIQTNKQTNKQKTKNKKNLPIIKSIVKWDHFVKIRSFVNTCLIKIRI